MSGKSPYTNRSNVIDLDKYFEERNRQSGRPFSNSRELPRHQIVNNQGAFRPGVHIRTKEVICISDDDDDVPLRSLPKVNNTTSSSIQDRTQKQFHQRLGQTTPNESHAKGQKRTFSQANATPPFSVASVKYTATPRWSQHHTEHRLQIRKKRRCSECVESGLECDGERPCSRCVEPGFDCVYDSDTNHALKFGPLNSSARPKTTNENESKAPASQVATTYGELVKSRPGMLFPLRSAIYTVPKQPPEILENNKKAAIDIPKDYKDVIAVVEQCQRNWQQKREYWLQAELLRARKRAQLTPNNPSPTAKVNPFRKLLAEAKEQEGNSQQTLKVQIKTKKEQFKTTTIPYMTLEVDYTLPILPRYRSIGRMGPNFLSKNVHTLTYMPYFAEEESINDTKLANDREAEMKQRYRNTSSDAQQYEKGLFDDLEKQRRCLERVHRLSSAFGELIFALQLTVDQLRTWVQRNALDECKFCKVSYKKSKTPESTAKLTEQETVRCEWLSKALFQVTAIQMWHFVERKHTDRVVKRKLANDQSRDSDIAESLCAICFLPNCLTHGSYVDGTDEDNEGGVLINDPEDENNSRQRAMIGTRSSSSDHLCGLFCVGRQAQTTRAPKLSDLLGLNASYQVVGLCNETVHMSTELSTFTKMASCNPNCFIFKHHRQGDLDLLSQSMPPLEKWQEKVLYSTTKLYSNNFRLPCLLARRMKISCMNAFKHLLALHLKEPHRDPDPSPDLEQARKLSKLAGGYKTHSSNDLDHRKPIVPCSHDGPCLASEGCLCARDNVYCEAFCACDTSCKRRFPGCRCKGRCFKDSRCDCWNQNRECDPWVCGTCGVLEVLDPSNKYNEEIRHGRCRNNFAQLDLPARTVKAPSEVQGWGLFAGQDMETNTYIGEYKGEIISGKEMQESDRRGVVYHNLGQEYLFIINSEQELDGSVFGNKTRFMNNSQRDENINVWAHRLISNGVVRVLFFTRRPVRAGEELLYNYNYDSKVTQFFWEKDEVQRTDGLMPIPKPRISGVDPRAARNTGVAILTDDETPVRKKDKAALRRQMKKKRIVEMDEDDESSDYDEDGDDESLMSGALARNSGSGMRSRLTRRRSSPDDDLLRRVFARDGSDEEDDYEEYQEDDSLQSEAEVEETDEEDAFNTASTKRGKPRQRRTFPGDRRYGGEAQRRAAKTRAERRKNAGK